MPEVVILGALAYRNLGPPIISYRIRYRRDHYQALINSRWRNVKVLAFMDWNPYL